MIAPGMSEGSSATDVKTAVTSQLLTAQQLNPIKTASLTVPAGSSFDTEEQELPSKFYIPSVPHVRQLQNYCGPASLSMVLNFWGSQTNQKTIGQTVFDRKQQATNGGDLLVYARNLGYSAYSYNSNMNDLKWKLASGIPIIVQQYFATNDNTYHFRVIIGYNDNDSTFTVSDPEETIETKISYSKFIRLWQDLGNWALLIVPSSRDVFTKELNDENPVLHMDLASTYARKKEWGMAEAEARKALKLYPEDPEMQSIVAKASRARRDH
jgi:predicted double-glycine peptidase